MECRFSLLALRSPVIMSSMPKYQAPKGTKDILSADAASFQELEAAARKFFSRFGFEEIRTPTFESLELFQRAMGETTDVVSKEMYVFEDRGGRKLALRPEGTAGVVRAFIEHHLSQTHPFCKLFYIGPMFRAERPQAGRYREFWQIGAEYFGNAAPAADAELLVMVSRFYESLGIQDRTLKINSLGCSNCRPGYTKALIDFLNSQRATLDEDCLKRIDTNPLRALDCKVDGPRLEASAPDIADFWDEACKTHFETVKSLLGKAGVAYERNSRLVRGLDYYSRTVFELTSSVLGAQNALAAGGRYDKLVKQMDGPDIPAIGFALGAERTIEAMRAAKGAEAQAAPGPVFVAALGDGPATEAFGLLQMLRLSPELAQAGVTVEGGFFEKKLGAQLTFADRLKASYCIIIGEDEVKSGEVTLKFLKEGTQEKLSKDKLVARLLKIKP